MRRALLQALAVGLLTVAAAAATAAPAPAATPGHADFHGQPASQAARDIADWVVATGDNKAMAFVIVDKVQARVFVFGPEGRLRGDAPALLGLARGDASVPGIGERPLASIRPEERTTPAGRFVASLGSDLGVRDVVWVDYPDAISLHRVITTKPKERRLQRLATPTPLDNRISYGCINVPARFYEATVRPAFVGASGVVYILPEVRPLGAVFAGYHPPNPGPPRTAAAAP